MAVLTDTKRRQILFQVAPTMAQSGQYRNAEEIVRQLRQQYAGGKLYFSSGTIAWLDELCAIARISRDDGGET